MSTPPPFLSIKDIKSEANAFLSRYHPDRRMPVPIEEIVEMQLGLDIVPMPNLRNDFGIDGYLSQDRTTIWVDEYQYNYLIRNIDLRLRMKSVIMFCMRNCMRV